MGTIECNQVLSIQICIPFRRLIILPGVFVESWLCFIKLLADDEPSEAQEIGDTQDDNDESKDFECITDHNKKGDIVIIDIHVICELRIVYDDKIKLFLVMALNHLHDLGDLENFEAVEQPDDLNYEEQTLLLVHDTNGLKWNQRDEIVKKLALEISYAYQVQVLDFTLFSFRLVVNQKVYAKGN